MAEIKPHFSDDRHILADVLPLRTPYCIQVEMSQICNLKCNYCIQSFVKKKRRFMEFETARHMLVQLRMFDDKIKQLNFAGWGEPLVDPVFRYPYFLRNIKRVENIALVTNGILLDGQTSLSLVEGGLNQLRVSLQGMNGKKYKEISGLEVYFQHIVDRIKFFYENKGQCQVYVKIADIALDKGDDKLFYDTFELISDRMYIESIRPMHRQNKKDGKAISRYGDDHPPVRVCPQPFYMLNVTATGEITPCCNYYNPLRLGNVLITTLKKAWESEKLRKFRLMLLTGKRKTQKEYPVCRDCLMPDATIGPGDELDSKAKELRERYVD